MKFHLTEEDRILYIGMTYKSKVVKFRAVLERGAKMHRTLFSPTMIETFRACSRAYQIAFINEATGSGQEKLGVICKQFILRAVAHINRGKLTTASQVQKYMGQYWPSDKLNNSTYDKDSIAKAFFFVYKTLLKYVGSPYAPTGATAVGAALKVRARVPHVRVYIEDTLDLVLWYPETAKLELVDFQIQPVKAYDPGWPTSSVLIKKFLADKLQTRWPFEELAITRQRIGIEDFASVSLNIEESTYRLHWGELVKNLEEMRELENNGCFNRLDNEHENCRYCQILQSRMSASVSEGLALSLIA